MFTRTSSQQQDMLQVPGVVVYPNSGEVWSLGLVLRSLPKRCQGFNGWLDVGLGMFLDSRYALH